MSTYWTKYQDPRTTRRWALKAGAAAAMGYSALSLIGCSGGDGGTEELDDSPRQLTQPVDTTGQAKKGGEWHGRQGADVQSFDAQTGQISDTPHATKLQPLDRQQADQNIRRRSLRCLSPTRRRAGKPRRTA